MVQQDYSIKSSANSNLFVKSWNPEVNVKVVVILVHGFGENCIRYTPYFELFEKYGIAFVAYDQYGHAKSEGKRGTIKSYNHLLDDVALVLAKADDLFVNIPKFIYGHSMGGNIAFNFMLERNTDLVGGIITSPWFTLTKEPPIVVKAIVSCLQRVLPNFTINSGLDLNALSSIKREVDMYRNDPLNHGRISFRLLHSITNYGLQAVANSPKLKVPTLLMHGSKDEITSPASSKKVWAKNKNKIEYKGWTNMFHEVHNDIVRSDMADFVGQWVLKTLDTVK